MNNLGYTGQNNIKFSEIELRSKRLGRGRRQVQQEDWTTNQEREGERKSSAETFLKTIFGKQ